MSRIPEHEKRHRAWTKKYLGALVGMTITAVGTGRDGFPYFKARDRAGNEVTCEISCDPEGNGPGFLFGLPAAFRDVS